MALREIEATTDLGEQFFGRLKIETEVMSERVRQAISNFVEYPAGPTRHASSPNNWMITEWFDYQVQKLAGKR